MKRVFDIIVSFIIIVLLIPAYLLISIFVVIYLGNPIFFTQIRPGKDCKPFKIIKFRSMTNAMDSSGRLLPNTQRMTRFGKFLRQTSLDEIPEFLNVIKGEMSLVGPRPLLMDYIPLFNQFQNKRHLVRPGITGWAQVNGRNAITWEDKFRYDVWYVQNSSFRLDLKILWLTLIKAFTREGITYQGDVAMPRFTGNDKT
jgi:sugar transferase EpsL